MRPAVAFFLLAAGGVAAYALVGAQSASAQSGSEATGDPNLTEHSNPNVLSPQQILVAARNAGFDDSSILTAVAIALAESGGDANAYNPESDYFARHKIDGTGKGSVGLWQIFQYAHPEFANLNLRDPNANASAAFSVSSGGSNFFPWSTFGNGAYRAHLDAAQAAYDAANQVPTLGIPCGGCVQCG
jgi:hypothetical protein